MMKSSAALAQVFPLRSLKSSAEPALSLPQGLFNGIVHAQFSNFGRADAVLGNNWALNHLQISPTRASLC